MGLVSIYPYRQHKLHWRIRLLMRRHAVRLWFSRVWACRSWSVWEWRTRYQSVLILERDVNKRVERAMLFGE